MIKIIRKEECCGCNACGDICPVQAISYETDCEGFWYPVVDTLKCINCDLCSKICPCINKTQFINGNFESPDCYSAEHKSIEVVFSSTTGGMFSALADVMYNEKGYVGGAIHNEDFSVSQYISNEKNDIHKLRRSKDLQSNAVGYYKKVKEILDAGERVLVCGLPCQIAGIKRYLQKDYDNLVTVDLICVGVNSPLVWKKYLDYIEELVGSKIVYTENKSKEYGWNNLTQKFVFENGEVFFDTRKTSYFIKGFIESHLFCRPSCYECRFKGFPRIADISIGDFWGIEKYNKRFSSDMGTSLVLVNSIKGKEFFEKAKRRINYESAQLEWAIKENPAIVKSISKLSFNRIGFFDDLKRYRFDDVVKKYSIKDGKIKTKLRKVKKHLKGIHKFIKTTHFNPKAVFQSVKYSGFLGLCHGKGIICGPNCYITLKKGAQLQFEGLLIYGRKDKFPHSHQESRLFVGENGSLRVLGNFEIDANNEIVIFEDAELVIHGGKIGDSDANAGLTIVCGQKIELMSDAGIGRNVTIRDTNGSSHFINTTGYRPSRPVVIGEKAWLCEACTIMPGVKIGRGAIVGGCSFVTRSVPDHAMVAGNPASVVQENVLWKW